MRTMTLLTVDRTYSASLRGQEIVIRPADGKGPVPEDDRRRLSNISDLLLAALEREDGAGPVVLGRDHAA